MEQGLSPFEEVEVIQLYRTPQGVLWILSLLRIHVICNYRPTPPDLSDTLREKHNKLSNATELQHSEASRHRAVTDNVTDKRHMAVPGQNRLILSTQSVMWRACSVPRPAEQRNPPTPIFPSLPVPQVTEISLQRIRCLSQIPGACF